MPVDLDASFHWLINLFIAGLCRPRMTDKQEPFATGNSG
jgi:hypothetical protein